MAGWEGATREGLAGGAMRRSPGLWYLAILVASVGILSIFAWDALRGRSRDHVLTLAPSPASLATESSGPPRSLIPQPKPSAVEPNTAPEARIAAFGTQAAQQAMPTPSAPVVIPPPAVAVPTPELQAIAPWPFATVTTTFTKLGRLSGASPGDRGKRPQNCLALWDPETHMTKEEWKSACERAPLNP